MPNPSLKALLSTFCLVFASFAFASDLPALDRMPTNAMDSCTLSQDEFNATWGSLVSPPPLDGVTLITPIFDPTTGMAYIFPPDGPNFSSDSHETENCAFFAWSEQMFLWVTSPIQFGDQLFLKSVPADVIPPDSSTNYVFSSEFFYRLDSFTTLQTQTNDGSADGNMALRVPKVDAPDSVGQAGETNGVLYTQANTDVSTESSLVYYEVHASRPYGYVRDALLNSAPAPYDFTEFPTDTTSICNAIGYGLDNGFIVETGGINLEFYTVFCKNPDTAVQALVQKYAAGGERVSGAELEVAVDFLAMAVELKTAWVEASTVADQNRYFVQQGSVPNFVPGPDGASLIQKGHKTIDLAMVGMHVVGTVQGHPEMVWATFEHSDNAPNANYFYMDDTGGQSQHSDLTADGNSQWLLSDGTAQGANTAYAVAKSKTGPNSGTISTIVASDSNPGDSVITPTNVNREHPWGSPATEASAMVNSEVISTNVAVINGLSNFYLGVDGDQASKDKLSISDPRLNYIMTGSSWGNMTFPTGSDVNQIAGTPAMANTTMETFTQSITDDSGNLNGCFTCHGIKADDAVKFDVSHIFKRIETVDK